jgi:ubiquinone/menaquinone biosynthesis C-methylase UbiE
MIKRKESFGLVAKQYQKYRSSYSLKIYKLLASLLGGKNKQYKILDIGCGTGKSTEPLVKIFKKAEIIGCDPDKAMLAEARRHAKSLKLPIDYIEGWAEKLPFENNFFDAIISGTAFHWFSTKKALLEISRTLKKKGLFFVFWNRTIKNDGVVDWLKIRQKYNWKTPVKKLTSNPNSLKKLFQKSGFKSVKIERTPFIATQSAEKFVGGLKTNSSYILLSEEKKKKLIGEIKEAFEKTEEKQIIIQKEIFICYGFKK